MAGNALIVGAGGGISAAFARALAKDSYKVALAARDTSKLEALAEETGATVFRCDVAERDSVAALFAAFDKAYASLDVVLYNPSYRVRGAFVDLDPVEVAKSLRITAYGGFLVAQPAVERMLAQGYGALFFTGASASVKGYPQSAPFAMGKFALRGLAQSLARELQPSNIHVAHFVIDGAVANPERDRRSAPEASDSLLAPEAVAHTYMAVLNQPRSAWTAEVALRPWLERF